MTKWKRWMAVSCSHGHLANANACRATIEFKKRWKPDMVLHLGDFIDLAALRSGAMRSADSSDRASSISEDFKAGTSFLRQLEPNYIFIGNHEDRLYSCQNSPNAVVSHCAMSALGEINDLARELKAKLVEYDIERGWIELGGTLFGHGFMFSEMATRDHAELLKKPCVFGHLHRVDRSAGRSIGAPVAWSIGCLADIGSMTYARRNRSVVRWQHGIAWGEYKKDAEGCTVNVLSPVGGIWRYPL